MGLIPKLKLVTVTTAGTPVPLLTPADVTSLSLTSGMSNIVACTIQAIHGTAIWVGDSTVLASSNTGIKLLVSALGTLQLTSDSKNVLDLTKVYVDGSANGDQASILFYIRV